MNYMPQMKYMFNNVSGTSSGEPASKRIRSSWPSTSSSPTTTGSNNQSSTGLPGSQSQKSPQPGEKRPNPAAQSADLANLLALSGLPQKSSGKNQQPDFASVLAGLPSLPGQSPADMAMLLGMAPNLNLNSLAGKPDKTPATATASTDNYFKSILEVMGAAASAPKSPASAEKQQQPAQADFAALLAGLPGLPGQNPAQNPQKSQNSDVMAELAKVMMSGLGMPLPPKWICLVFLSCGLTSSKKDENRAGFQLTKSGVKKWNVAFLCTSLKKKNQVKIPVTFV